MVRFFSGCYWAKFIFLSVTLLTISSCSSKTTVVLLPDLNGKVGAVSVATSAGSIDIKTANQATTVSGRKSIPSAPMMLKRAAIDAVFAEALHAQPKPPIHFLLYFVNDSNELRPDSLDSLPTIIQVIEKRNSVDITIVGHTDTVGSNDYNYTLSKNRAKAVAKIFVNRGVQQNHIKTTSHGERNLLIHTGDNVREPRNRRVEVVVK